MLHQIYLYFLLPLALAIVHSYFGLRATKSILQMLALGDSFKAVLPVGFILLTLYLIYMISTYFNARRVIEK